MGTTDATVVLLMDSVRRDALACYGGPHDFERIDRMASEGVVYTNMTSPTGWSPDVSDVIAEKWETTPNSVFLYDNPTLRNCALLHKFPVSQHLASEIVPPVDIAPIINWWLRYQECGLVFFWSMATHAPYYSWGEEHRFLAEKPALWADDSGIISYPIPHLQQDLHYIMARYYGAIAAIDRYVLPQIDAARIILLSDHGECFGEHKLWGHARRQYRELTEIPLVVHGVGCGTVDESLSIDRLYSIASDTMSKPVVSGEMIVRQRLADMGYLAASEVAASGEAHVTV